MAPSDIDSDKFFLTDYFKPCPLVLQLSNSENSSVLSVLSEHSPQGYKAVLVPQGCLVLELVNFRSFEILNKKASELNTSSSAQVMH